VRAADGRLRYLVVPTVSCRLVADLRCRPVGAPHRDADPAGDCQAAADPGLAAALGWAAGEPLELEGESPHWAGDSREVVDGSLDVDSSSAADARKSDGYKSAGVGDRKDVDCDIDSYSARHCSAR
jgi:hypothetical protein